MNSKQRKTLAAVFADPVSATIAWKDVEGLLIAVGFELFEGKGSAIRLACRDVEARFHRPRPGKEAKRYQVRDARLALTKIGVSP